jgi:hypothetical protein
LRTDRGRTGTSTRTSITRLAAPARRRQRARSAERDVCPQLHPGTLAALTARTERGHHRNTAATPFCGPALTSMNDSAMRVRAAVTFLPVLLQRVGRLCGAVLTTSISASRRACPWYAQMRGLQHPGAHAARLRRHGHGYQRSAENALGRRNPALSVLHHPPQQTAQQAIRCASRNRR